MKILVANLGSTSLKYRLFDCGNGQERLLTRGGFERVADYAQAIDSCLRQLLEGGWIQSEKDLAAVGFKPILARGITGCVPLDQKVLAAMEACNQIAPAHNPPYVNGVRLFAQRMPSTPLVGLFETAFYQWAPETAMRYAVPEAWYQQGVRRWGYHGASHKYIAERSAELMGREDVAQRARQLYVDDGKSPVRAPDFRVISCHLGGSSSITGILNGVGVGNSMGMSPQSGLPQNNRVGDFDSFALPFMMRATGLTLDEAERVLCRESGLKALSGGANDMRDIMVQAAKGDSRAQLAMGVLVHQARHWIGAYFLQLNGIDALVFTGGIAENSSEIRQEICRNLDQLGILLDPAVNAASHGQEVQIGSPASRVRIQVIPANEELVIAREVRRYLQKDHAAGAAQAPVQNRL
ncbi:MAG: acetate kinase [Candidatus Omnitrophica bacterium]|nr:acetate kinase [Candidatus Omnitrophota bacterium]